MGEINKKIDLMKIVTDGEQPPNCDLTLQIKATYAHNGVARGIWTVDEKFINGIGVAMGGFVASAADIMMAYAIASKLDAEQMFTSIDLHTTFHRPVLTGEVVVEAKVERMGKKVVYVLADLFQNEKKAASVVSTVMIINE
ncbi:PaaI family thioesterase [Bacillus sp. EB600]|uniref:PaaI family thioesterase n=1 Tax=Bacillus sp. EB600 TaxID=2806345 RepID=UPI00210B077E|nr:PaaI family thioesterase [Bacillus sp. EB600]MCQ6278853.1 PaaI family thioesterase [Bacillus sp. EB600]